MTGLDNQTNHSKKKNLCTEEIIKKQRNKYKPGFWTVLASQFVVFDFCSFSIQALLVWQVEPVALLYHAFCKR